MSQASIRKAIDDEIIRCAVDPVHFFKKHVKVQHPKRGKIPFDLYQFQEDALREICNHRYVIILKSRQMGISTLMAAFGLHKMLFTDDFKILVIATTQERAKGLVKMVQLAWELLPAFLKQGISVINNNKLEISFSNGSSIKAVSSSPSAARGESISLLIFDEAAWIRDMDEIWQAAQMTLATGGDCIMLSTPAGSTGVFHQEWGRALEGSKQDGIVRFHPISLPWYLHPERDQLWRDQQDEILGKLKAAIECDCIWGDSIVTVQDIKTGKVKQISLSSLYNELEPLLTCKICGYTNKQLHQHLLSKHSMTSIEYRNIYGAYEQMQYNFDPPENKSIDLNQSIRSLNMVRRYKDVLTDDIEILNKFETREKLLYNDLYKQFLGRSKNRTLFNFDKKLYKSIFNNTEILNNLFKHVKLSQRIKFIVDYDYDLNHLSCKCGLKLSFNDYCRSCKPNYPSIEWFIWKYDENWEDEYQIFKNNHTQKGNLSLNWFKERYGEYDYFQKFKDHYEKRFNPCEMRYSKISQELFKEIQQHIPEICEFATGAGERKIYLNQEEILASGQIVYYLDLFYKNKNIEYDSEYYKKDSNQISIRDQILKNRGIAVLRINHLDYIKQKKKIIAECVRFLND